MLTRLYKKTMQREMDNALRTVDAGPSRRPKPTKRSPQVNHNNKPSQLRPEITPTLISSTHIEMATPTASTYHTATPSAFDYPSHRAQALPDEPVVSYLQFESLRHNDRMDPHLNEHLDEAYGAFEQMFNLDFADFPFEPY